METKKIFSAGLAISTLLSGTVSAEGNMNSQVTTNADSRWNKEKVKSFLKKSAPYVAVGVPSAALLIGLAVYAYKKNSNEKNVQQQNSNSQSQTDDGSVRSPVSANHLVLDKSHPAPFKGENSGSSQHPSPTNPFVPNGPHRVLSQEEINSFSARGELPGIKLWKVVIRSFFYSENNCYYFYTITDLPLAESYFDRLDIRPEEREIIFKWQNHSIYRRDFDKIFGNMSEFKKMLERLIPIEGCFKKCSNKLLTRIKESGFPALTREIDGYDDMTSSKNQEACKHINEKLNVTTPHDTNPSSKDDFETRLVQDSAKVFLEIASGEGVVGSGVIENVREDLKNKLQEQLKNGRLLGFKFYRYDSGLVCSTRYCYIITDYKLAKVSLSGIGIDDDTAWKKVVLFQNRWLSKKGDKWSFENIFNFEDNIFWKYFDEITRAKTEKREGSETLSSDRAGKGNFGDSVFSENSKELEVSKGKLSNEAMNYITSKSIGYKSFIRGIEIIKI